MPVLALGVSYRRAPVELLERLAIAEESELKAYGRLEGLESVRESAILSTCNRVEVYAEVTLYHQGFQDLKRFLSEATDVPVEEFAEPLYSHYEDDTAEHLFSVAAGLDSMVIGEPQILAQVRGAYRRAQAEGATGPNLGRLFQRAVRAGRRAREETGVGASPAAFIEAGVDLAERHLGRIRGTEAVVVGAGEMGGLAARVLRDRGVARVTVLSRRPARAERLAKKVGGRHGGLDALPEALEAAELVVSSTQATAPVIAADVVRRAAERSPRPRFLLDLAVPRDVEPTAADVPGVALADIDDLGQALEGTGGDPREEVARAWTVVRDEARRFAVDRRTARLAPLIEALHARGEAVRAAELRRMAGRLDGLSEREREAVEAATRRIVRRLLHDPVVRLKDLAGRGAEDGSARALAELFGLEPPGD
ncbi:MAG TPA: glutamyl-tRNA reductase [Actinomycetota bacterium]|nr:glutamyl-tRNA reductase [Actinomycetota bacterium]